MSPDGLTRHGVSETVAARVARDLGLEYEAVDLSKSDRTTLGIGDAPQFTICDLYHPSDSGQAFPDAMFGIEG